MGTRALAVAFLVTYSQTLGLDPTLGLGPAESWSPWAVDIHPSDKVCASAGGDQLSRDNPQWQEFAARHAQQPHDLASLKEGEVSFAIYNHTLYHRSRFSWFLAGRSATWHRGPPLSHDHRNMAEIVAGLLTTVLRRYPRGSIPDGSW